MREALARLDAEGPHTDDVRLLVEFIRASTRGVIMKRAGRARDGDE
jgi:hypothetical protein